MTIFEENVAAQAARRQRDYWFERDRAAMEFVNRKFAEEKKRRRRTTLWHGLLILGAIVLVMFAVGMTMRPAQRLAFGAAPAQSGEVIQRNH